MRIIASILFGVVLASCAHATWHATGSSGDAGTASDAKQTPPPYFLRAVREHKSCSYVEWEVDSHNIATESRAKAAADGNKGISLTVDCDNWAIDHGRQDLVTV